jgi:hypothetical protein
MMTIKNDLNFIRQVENLIEPQDVDDLIFFQTYKKLLPSALFRWILEKTSKRNPRIGFVIEPYSLFLFFKLTDVERAKAMLPDRYELIRTEIFAGDEPDYYLGMGILTTRATTFWGTRLESYLIARDRETGLKSWIFIDILSDTLIALPKVGVTNPNCRRAMFSTNSRGGIFLSMNEQKTNRRIALTGKVTGGTMRKLDEPLWLMGNTSIAHSKKITGRSDDPFAVVFDPGEVEQALDIPPEDIQLEEDTLFPGLAEPHPSKVLCFPYAQHYIADSPGCRTYVKDREDMIDKYNKIAELKEMKTFSPRFFKRFYLVGATVMSLAAIGLLIDLLLSL